MIWTDESHIVIGDQLPATKPTREAKLALALALICILVIWIMLSVGSLPGLEARL